MLLAFRGTFFVISFEEFDKLINFSSEQCVDFKNVNSEIKKKWQLRRNIALLPAKELKAETRYKRAQTAQFSRPTDKFMQPNMA